MTCLSRGRTNIDLIARASYGIMNAELEKFLLEYDKKVVSNDKIVCTIQI